MIKHNRTHTALLLVTIYSVIVMSPLAPLALRSASVAHAVTGECVGDCALCGCSPEQSANRTCCCWKKKQQHGHGQEHAGVADSCKNKKHSSKPVLSCGCPCGGSKHLALWGGENQEQLPYHFIEGIAVFPEDVFPTYPQEGLTDRRGDPPDPPPKLAFSA
ncbi:MAG TPA: hypothetical protein VIU40_05050 [Geobacteraceae bacterium]